MTRLGTTRRAALAVLFLTVFSIAPAFADGGSQTGSGGKSGPGNGGKVATPPADPVAALLAKVRALFGL